MFFFCSFMRRIDDNTVRYLNIASYQL